MENLDHRQPNRIPSVNIAIVGSVEVGLPALIKSEGLADALGATSLAATLSTRENAPIVLESKRLDIFYDSATDERDLLEGIPSELQPGRVFASKGVDDPTSISSRMVHRPSMMKGTSVDIHLQT